MPPRVTYWTGTWDPVKEAISKEVDLLRRRDGQAPAIGFSPGNRSRLHLRERVLTLSHRRWWTLRAVARLVEPTGDISHVFSGVAAWHWLELLRRRPVIFTVVSGGPTLPPSAYDHVTAFVAESPQLVGELCAAGIPADRIRMIAPGVDLSQFAPVPAPAGNRFRILFASWPEQPSQLEPRGVHTLIEVARRCPDVEVVLLVRRWGDCEGTRRAVESLAPPANVMLQDLGNRSMAAVYASAHACAALFAPGHGKSAPNSVIEAMACGRPVLMGAGCGIGTIVQEAGAGVLAGQTVGETLEALVTLRAGWSSASVRARALAESAFSQEAFLAAYAALYGEVGMLHRAGVQKTPCAGRISTARAARRNEANVQEGL